LNCAIETIESDSFSNLEQLCSLNLYRNQIEFIEENAFKPLKNLKKLNLRNNELTNFDPKFVGLEKSVEVFIGMIENVHRLS
jgi:Leucine-rich repeat (LRR) protein